MLYVVWTEDFAISCCFQVFWMYLYTPFHFFYTSKKVADRPDMCHFVWFCVFFWQPGNGVWCVKPRKKLINKTGFLFAKKCLKNRKLILTVCWCLFTLYWKSKVDFYVQVFSTVLKNISYFSLFATST
jgi:hypothetical protein